ncbi:MAG: high-affinity nickel-transporter [Candidatus Rokuibacteriota bacterium]|nr:MAG: high-affinity nickel-transporter [Candidatus Rokubacteria bacterium]
MRKLLLFLALLAVVLAVPVAASAHPLGNFTINRFSRIQVSGGHVYVRYVLDMAEIPTFQAKPTISHEGEGLYASRLTDSIGRGLVLAAGGRRLPLQPQRHELAFPPGQAGLQTLRLEAVYASTELPGGVTTRLEYKDTNYSGRLGWKEIVVDADAGARSRAASVPARTISDELRSYPKNLLQSPLDVTEATATVVPGHGPGRIPTLIPRSLLERRVGVRAVTDSGFAALITEKHLGALVILGALAVAFFWGLVHALSPGHGKAIITAYLVGQRGKPRHAAYLGLIVTVTHTAGVFALGAVTLLLSRFIVPEILYPWLNLVSGLLVVGIAASVFWARLTSRKRRATAYQHHRDHRHHSGHEHSHGGRPHSHAPTQPGWRGLFAAGVSGGLIPCPSALVVLLAALSLHRVAFGLLLIVAFSAGLALTITGIGLVAVLARSVFKRASFEGRLVRALPAASALVILAVGLAMTARALPKIA